MAVDLAVFEDAVYVLGVEQPRKRLVVRRADLVLQPLDLDRLVARDRLVPGHVAHRLLNVHRYVEKYGHHLDHVLVGLDAEKTRLVDRGLCVVEDLVQLARKVEQIVALHRRDERLVELVYQHAADHVALVLYPDHVVAELFVARRAVVVKRAHAADHRSALLAQQLKKIYLFAKNAHISSSQHYPTQHRTDKRAYARGDREGQDPRCEYFARGVPMHRADFVRDAHADYARRHDLSRADRDAGERTGERDHRSRQLRDIRLQRPYAIDALADRVDELVAAQEKPQHDRQRQHPDRPKLELIGRPVRSAAYDEREQIDAHRLLNIVDRNGRAEQHDVDHLHRPERLLYTAVHTRADHSEQFAEQKAYKHAYHRRQEDHQDHPQTDHRPVDKPKAEHRDRRADYAAEQRVRRAVGHGQEHAYHRPPERRDHRRKQEYEPRLGIDAIERLRLDKTADRTRNAVAAEQITYHDRRNELYDAGDRDRIARLYRPCGNASRDGVCTVRKPHVEGVAQCQNKYNDDICVHPCAPCITFYVYTIL